LRRYPEALLRHYLELEIKHALKATPTRNGSDNG
jgi:hypothetical protein